MLLVEHVSAAYRAVPLLHNISLKVGTGQFVSLIGANGAGHLTKNIVAVGYADGMVMLVRIPRRGGNLDQGAGRQRHYGRALERRR